LLHYKGKNQAAFMGAYSAKVPKTWNTPEANANETLSNQIQYQMAVSRFASRTTSR
jgi:type VI secretion system protein ImpC